MSMNALAGFHIFDDRSGADLAAGRVKYNLHQSTDRWRLGSGDQQPPQSQRRNPGDGTAAAVLPGNEHALRQRNAREPSLDRMR